MAFRNSLWSIHSEEPHGCLTDRRNWTYEGVLDPKMFGPTVPPWVEEPDNLSRPRIDRGNVTAFVPVAQHAGIRQVVRDGEPALLATDDMISLVREAGVVFMDEAIFAAVLRTAGYLGSEFLADITSHERGFGGP